MDGGVVVWCVLCLLGGLCAGGAVGLYICMYICIYRIMFFFWFLGKSLLLLVPEDESCGFLNILAFFFSSVVGEDFAWWIGEELGYLGLGYIPVFTANSGVLNGIFASLGGFLTFVGAEVIGLWVFGKGMR